MGVRRRGRFRVETVLSSSAEPIFLLNPDREVVFFNRSCEELTGRSAAQAVGLACQYRGPVGSQDLPDLGASLAPPPEVFQGELATVQSLFIRPDGERFWRHIQFFPCHDESGRLLAIIGLVSERANPSAGSAPPHIELHAELLRLRDRLYRRYGLDKIVCASPAMRRVLDQVRVACQTDASVLVWGESGTGKELVARTIHHESARKAGPCVPIDCAVVPPDVLERDLFGSDPEREWGLSGSRPGLIRHARGGTLFLMNLSRLSRDLQSRLADMLSDARPGELIDASGDRISLRLMSSDRIDPAAAVAAGELRPDLYFTLSTIVIYLPPLRERKADLPLLAQMCVESANAAGQKQVAGVSPAAMEVLSSFDWPGNVHELDEVIRETHARCRSHLIEPGDLPPRIQGAQGGAYAPPPAHDDKDYRIDLDAVLVQAERKLIEQALRRARGNKSRAAELLSISRPRLYRRMVMLGMEKEGTEAVAGTSQGSDEDSTGEGVKG